MSTEHTRVSPNSYGLIHQEEEDGKVVFYEPEDELENLGKRWIASYDTVTVRDMR